MKKMLSVIGMVALTGCASSASTEPAQQQIGQWSFSQSGGENLSFFAGPGSLQAFDQSLQACKLQVDASMRGQYVSPPVGYSGYYNSPGYARSGQNIAQAMADIAPSLYQDDSQVRHMVKSCLATYGYQEVGRDEASFGVSW